MLSSEISKRPWAARVGVAALVAGSAFVGGVVGVPSAQAAVVATISPSTGPAGGVISITSPTANTFRTSGGTLRVANSGGVIAANAIQFSLTACPTTTGPIPSLPRTVADAVTNGSTTVTSALANFTAADVGRVIQGTNIPNGATITTIGSSTSVTISAAATGSGTGGTLNIGVRKVADLATTSGSTTVTSATAGFHAGDVGSTIVTPNLPAATTITTVNSPTSVTVSAPATATGSAQTATLSTRGPAYGATPSDVTVLSGTKLIVRAPANMVSVPAGTTYNVCVYDTGGSAATVLTTGTYKVYSPPTITDVSATSGPAQGGNTLTVTGTNITAAARVTVGGTALENAVVNAAAGTVTGTVPARAAGSTNIVLTTEGGPVTYGTQYTYYDGLDITPSTMTPTESPILDIFGQGFRDATVDFANLAPASVTTIASADPSTEVITTAGAHGFTAGDRVRLGTVTGLTPLVSNATYWVLTAPSGTTLTLGTAPGGTAVDITLTGTTTGLYDVDNMTRVQLGAATFTTTTNVVSWSGAHGLAVGDVVVFTGTITTTTSIDADTEYYVLTVPSSTSVTLSPVKGGSVQTIDATGGSAGSYRGADNRTHVLLALGAYDETAALGTAGAPVAECTGVQVISDNELICSLVTPNLRSGSYQVFLVDDLKAGTTRATIASSASAFTSAAY